MLVVGPAALNHENVIPADKNLAVAVAQQSKFRTRAGKAKLLRVALKNEQQTNEKDSFCRNTNNSPARNSTDFGLSVLPCA